MNEKEHTTEDEITEILKRKLNKKNLLFQNQALILMKYEANGSPQKASEVFKKVYEFAKFHNDSVLSTHITSEAIKEMKD